MTPHNRVLVLIGGVALIASASIGLVLIPTTAADAALQADQLGVRRVQTLGDELLVEVREQQDALDDYILSEDPQALGRFRIAVTDETAIAAKITAATAWLPGVAAALRAVDAENIAWRARIAEPAITVMQSGRPEALTEAIQIRVQDQQTSQIVTGSLLGAIDAADVELSSRADALTSYRVAASILGAGIALLAAGLSLWFVRRYGLRVAGDERRRARAGIQRIEIVASLRSLRTQATPEATAALMAGALTRLPWVDIAGVFERVDDGLVLLAGSGTAGFPLHGGDVIPKDQARYLLDRCNDGPWADSWVDAALPGGDEAALAAVGIKSMAFAPIQFDDQVIGLIGFATTDAAHGRHLVEDLPAVGEFASVAETILAPALVSRQRRAAERHRIEAVIARGAFHPVFQPVVDLATGATVGFEALTRFDDDCPPDQAFAAAIACGMGIELETATLAAALRESGHLASGAWLGLNVSPALLVMRTGLERLLAARPGRIVVEITEHETIAAYAPLREAIRQLGPRVRLAVDDAGAGVANFNHLVELRPSFVKIDVSLIRGVDTDPSRRALVVGLVHFAAESGSTVLAEGIETEAERATVAELGVTLGQGYLLGRPAASEAWSVMAPPQAVRLRARPKAAATEKVTSPMARPRPARPARTRRSLAPAIIASVPPAVALRATLAAAGAPAAG